MSVIDNYLQKIQKDKRDQLERIRKIGKQVIPDAAEVISYGMPTLQYKGKSFLGFDIHKNHIGIYPYGGEEIEVFKNKLIEQGFEYSTGAIRVPLGRTFPEELLVSIIKHRVKRIT